MAKTKRILIVEDDPEATALIRRGLEPEAAIEVELPSSLAGARAAIDRGGGQSVGDVMQVADTACCAAKLAGRNRIHIYLPEDVEIARRQGEMRWVSRILMDQATRFIGALRERGCHFALDDFGTGASFGYLRTLPVDFVKIDGIFVKGILNDPADDVLVASINRIAHALGKKTIAEYVESKQILQRMAEIGVDYVQGCGVGRPEPIGAMGSPDALRALGS